MKTESIKVQTKLANGEVRKVEGEVTFYELSDLDTLTLDEQNHIFERYQEMERIREQDKLRNTLKEEDPAKAILKILKAKMKEDPEGFKKRLEEAGLTHLK